MINYLALIVSFTGLIFGKLLAKYVRDEIKEYKTKINIARRITLGFIIVISLFLGLTITSLVLTTIAALAAIFFMRKLNRPNIKIDYVFLGMISITLYMLQIDSLMFIMAVLIFLYGIFYSSINSKFNVLVHGLEFFLPTVFLLLPLIYAGYILGFSATSLAFMFKD